MKINKTISISIILFSSIFLLSSLVSASVDFSGLTDLINATMNVLKTFVNNASTLVGFIVLVVELGLVTIIGSVIAMFLYKIVKKVDGKV